MTKKQIEELKKKDFKEWKRNRINELKSEVLEEAKKGMKKALSDPFKMDELEKYLDRMDYEIDKTIEKEEDAVLESIDKKYEDMEIETD